MNARATTSSNPASLCIPFRSHPALLLAGLPLQAAFLLTIFHTIDKECCLSTAFHFALQSVSCMQRRAPQHEFLDMLKNLAYPVVYLRQNRYDHLR